MSHAFFDTNILIYAFGTTEKSARAQQVLSAGGVVGVQSLNEFTVVALRKLKLDWPTIQQGLAAIRVLCPTIIPLTDPIHRDGLRIAQRYRLSIYDSMIVSAALQGGCTRLWSEDLQDGLRIDERLTVANPFG
ncbi:PIN domain-containing protein [Sphingomonas sp. CFBP 13720]|uniref:PIN domain-containing protein n=1 Tax=Sphingomonas sp. CFBP 13720 TaxID=2775302 RepID=UPI00177FE0B2|nr:PIN domain-containing protein [Sphingomonas sp. CFBP 13720]